MNLQLSLLILGAIGIGLVFILHRYSDKIERFRKKLKQQAKLKERSKRLRQSGTEPILGDHVEPQDELDAPLFEFNKDTLVDDAYQQQSLIVDEPQPEPTVEAKVRAPETNSEPDNPAIQKTADPKQTAQAPVSQHKPADEDRITTLKPVPSGPFTSLRQIDYWVKLSPTMPVSQAEIMAGLGDWSRIKFPVQIHALTQEAPHWVDVHDIGPATMIADVVASYQLLTHGKATTLDDLLKFDQSVTALGESLKAEKLMMASAEQALEQSERLHNFYEQSHGPLEVAVVATEGQAFMGKLVETSAKQQGLDFHNGEYVRLKRMASSNIILYRMINNDRHGFVSDMSASGMIHSVRFSMVPSLSPTPGRDAKEMLDAVKAFASRVKGDIRIPGQTEFHNEQLLNLRNRVSKLEKEMIDAGLEPGSQEILRIFS